MSLDSMINQHLQSLKAGNPMLRPSGPGASPPAMALAAQLQQLGQVQRPPQAPPPQNFAAGGPPPPALGAPAAPGAAGGAPQLATVPGAPRPQGPSSSLVSVAIDNIACKYQLLEADLRETFQRWGPLVSVQIYQEGTREVGVINFADQIDASDALRQLNGFNCNFDGKPGTLIVVPGGPEQLSPSVVQGLAGAAPAMAKAAPMPGDKGGGKGFGSFDMARPPWSCKIVVQAESLHPQFPIAQKIVGMNNANVQHIQSQTNCMIRIRGRGSGYNEPETGAELQEPMAIWLASDGPQTGQPALDMAQDLLKSVYEEHANWCQQSMVGTAPPMPDPPVILAPETAGAMAATAPSSLGSMGAPGGPLLAPGPSPTAPCQCQPGGMGPGPGAPAPGIGMGMPPGACPAPGMMPPAAAPGMYGPGALGKGGVMPLGAKPY